MWLVDLLEELEIAARAANRSESTISSYLYQVTRFVRWLETQSIPAHTEHVTARVVRDYQSYMKQQYAPQTIANNTKAIKRLFSFGVDEGLIPTNPIEKVVIPAVADTNYEVFSVDDIDTLLRSCDTKTLIGLRDFAIVMLLFDSGIRATELCRLSDDAIQWKRGMLAIHGKGARDRLVPISGRTVRALRKYMIRRNRDSHTDPPAFFLNQRGGQLSRSGLEQMLERMGERTGLHVHPHKFRHSFAVNALRNDAREFDIQQCLGHTSLQMTRHYARQSGEDLARRHRMFSPADRLKVRF